MTEQMRRLQTYHLLEQLRRQGMSLVGAARSGWDLQANSWPHQRDNP